MRLNFLLITTAILAVRAAAFAAPTPAPGVAAPPLAVKEWIKGKPVDLKAGRGTNVYVVEFWATWCGPCRVSIPHLTELQARFRDKGVVFVGVSDETADKVRPFVEKMGSKMDYAVAVDDRDQTSKAYMGAFKISTIPHAFVVDRSGAIVWNGHPMAGLDKVLEQVVEGRFDPKRAARSAGVVQLAQRYLTAASTGQTGPELEKMGRQVVEDGADNPALLNQFAWAILTNKRVTSRDLPLALAAAQRAYESAEGKDPGIADTCARALFDNGKIAEAIKMQQKAIELCKDDRLKEDLRATLKRYETAEIGR